MPRPRTVAAVTAAMVALGAGGYAVADIYDIVPGVLTIVEPVDPQTLPPVEPEPEPEVTGIVPVPQPRPGEGLLVPAAEAPLPDREALQAAVDSQLADPGFYGSAAVVVADARTGEVLYDHRGDQPVAPASTQKLLSGAAVLTTLDPGSRFTTSVVRTGAAEIALVAGGDTMLAAGHGDPTATEGYAGLADLAEQTVTRLQQEADAPTEVTVSVDMTFAAGPRYAPRWNMEDIRIGYNQGVTMIGLAGQRPKPFHPSPTEPEREAVTAFAAALTEAGLPATVAAEPVLTDRAEGPRLAHVRSATVAEITDLAMDDSDNALTEALTRLASFASGGPTDFESVATFVLERVAALGVDITGAHLLDSSGMTYDQVLPARVITDVILLGTTGADPRITDLIADLPIGGLDGTLHDRYLGASTQAVGGIPRAKTGTINATIALAGTTMSRDGRLLVFTTIADAVPREGRLQARLALDRLVTALTECGCAAPQTDP